MSAAESYSESDPVGNAAALTRVLVVDDSPIDRMLAGGLLASQPGMTIDYAEHGQAALDAMERQPPDIVLTDLQMPQLDGLALVEAIRERFPDIPAILMTAHGSEEIAISALQRGAASYVAKRNMARRLVETVRDVLASSSEGRQERRLFECWRQTEFAFEFDNDATRIPAFVSHLQRYVSSTVTCDHTEFVRVGVALHEALRNAIHHGNLELSSDLRTKDSDAYYEEAERRRRQPQFAQRRVHVVARESPDAGTYVICDEGPGFDTNAVYDPTTPEHLDIPSGRGLFLIRMFMDEVSFNPRGNQITMTHRRRKIAANR